MKVIIATAAVLSVLVVPIARAQAPTGRVTPEFPKAGSQSAEPGATGPGSENKATTSPTSPNLPASKQAPPEVPANDGSSSGSAGTSGPHNPTPFGSNSDVD